MPAPASVRFVHLADVHLGYRQYGLRERAADFARAFGSVIRYCLAQHPDFVIIAGDLFDAKSIEPQTYADADAGLAALATAGIPVVAVEGNHERWFRRGDRSWLWQLSRQGRLRLLQQYDPESGDVAWTPWTAERGFGAYTDIGPVRVFGVEYLGARLRAALPEVLAAAQAQPANGRKFRVGVLHTGVEEELPFAQSGLSLADLLNLRPIADVIALGHVHYRFELPADDPWIFNPGSLEAHNVLEGLLDDEPVVGAGRARGIFDVHVRLTDPPGFDARFVDDVIERRAFKRFLLPVTDVADADGLAERLDRSLRAEPVGSGEAPIVEVVLRGRLEFERARLDTNRLVEVVRERLRPLHTRVTLQLESAAGGVGVTRGTSRLEIERRVLRELIAADARYPDAGERLERAALALKAGVTEAQTVEDLAAIVEGTLD